ncbi:MAG: GcrA cell cycle regulator [Hyphomicrobiales bacterium]|mgnify:CR=1 FL=1|nr:MAG: GcrA cell cycle regulator [Hyphomicrobiales bacterium]
MSWSDERVELLKKLWADGLSASQIAGELGGVTRNAVIGKVHRLGLSGRGKTASQSSKPRKPRSSSGAAGSSQSQARPSAPRTVGATALKADYVPAPKPVVERRPAPVADLVIPIEERATILTLTESKCKWPIGDPTSEDFYFCGRRSDPGVPYCEHHARIAYQPASDRRRDKRAARG